MEEGLEQSVARLLAVVVVGENGLGGGAAEVETVCVDVNGGGGREHVKGPDDTGTGRPRVAENGLVVAVEDGHVGGLGEDGKLSSGSVESLFDGFTAA